MSSFRPPILFALDSQIQPDEYALETAVTMLGRAEMCQIVIPRQTISRVHATIERDKTQYFLHDANSANGTYVNGRRILEPHLLKHQDVIGLSSAEGLLRFEDLDATAKVSGQLRYDAAAMLFFLDQKPLDLSPSQFKLLLHLYQHLGQVCTRESCAEAIWGREYDPALDTAALDQAVSNVRRKMRQIDPEADMLQTRRGLGYMLIL